MSSPEKQSDRSKSTRWDLKPDTEFRFEVAINQSVTVRLVTGTAEIYGAELAVGRDYVFSGIKYAIYSFDGATIEVVGECGVEYMSSECVVPYFLNLHLCLENIRGNAQKQLEHVPRVLVLGTGRNTCARTLLNYAVRQERSPLVVDLDVANGSLLFPGTIACSVINRLIEPEEEFSTSNPLAYYYGSPNWSDNPRCYFQILASIANQINERLSIIENLSHKGDRNKYSGLVGIFPSWIDGKAEKLLEHALKALQINVIVVVGNERLYNFIKKEHESDRLRILSISKSPGLVSKDTAYRRHQTSKRIREYFYGHNEEFYPYSQTVGFKDVEIWKIEDGLVAPISALPIGAERKLEDLSINKVDVTPALTYSILGISQLKLSEDSSNSSELPIHGVFGFICVTEVDMQKEKITFLCTCPGKLPNNVLLQGNVKWVEEHKR